MKSGRGAAMHSLVGAYVLDALSARELAEFERHLLGCEQCRDDSRELREVTARLSAAAAVAPRPELRDQTMRAAARMRQLPPRTASRPDRGLTRLPAFRRLTALVTAGGTGRQAWLARIAAGVAAVLAVTAIALGLHMTAMQGRLTAAQQRDDAIAAVLGAHDATRLTADISTGGMATVVMSHQAHALVFMATGLASLPASKAYEVWLMSPAGSVPAGMLPPERGGMTGPMVVSRVATADQLVVTVEPAAGSVRPTSPPVVIVNLGS